MTNFELPVSLTKENVMDVDRIIRKIHTESSELAIDCHQVNNIDSTGIALLLMLKQTKTPVHYQLLNLTPVINNICNLYSITI